MASAPSPSRVARARQGDPFARVTLAGRAWDFSREWTARQDMECLRVTGRTIPEMFEAMEHKSIAAVAVVVWLARQQYGDAVTLDQVLDDLDTAAEIDVEVISEDEANPPA